MPTLASDPTAKIRGIGSPPVEKHNDRCKLNDHSQDASATLLSVSELLQQHLPRFARQYLAWLPPHVLNVLARLSLCRSRSLGRHCFQCPDCEGKSQVYNSCGERHCPQCGGARRKDWLEKTALLMLPGVAYFQVVLTVPDSLSPLILANRKTLYGLIMRSAWTTLREYLAAQGIQPAALLVLHTWNQRLKHHPHIHALVPAGGLSTDGQRWVPLDHLDQSLAETNRQLGQRFRALLIRGVIKCLTASRRRTAIHLPGTLAPLAAPGALKVWLATVAPDGFRVFLQPPPTVRADPQQLLKYLARYLSGGPISDRRLVSQHHDKITFLARSLTKPKRGERHQQVAVEIPSMEFVWRWSLHILPKGMVRVRHYGHFGNRHRTAYLARCNELLGNGSIAPDVVADTSTVAAEESHTETSLDNNSAETDNAHDSNVVETDNSHDNNVAKSLKDQLVLEALDAQLPSEESEVKPVGAVYHCPKCQQVMICTEANRRPSWADTMKGPHRPKWCPRSAKSPRSNPSPGHPP